MKKVLAVVGLVVMVLGMTSVVDVEARGKGGRGGHGGYGGHGGHGGKGGHGGHGGKGGASVSAPAVSAGPAASAGGAMTTGVQGDGRTSAEAKLIGNGTLTAQQAQTDRDTREALAEAGHFGLVTVDRINADGSFTYSGYEWAVVAFAQAMQKRGYEMGWMGQPSTNFSNGLMTEALGG